MKERCINEIKFEWQRVLYTLCFFSLCIIDWMKGSLNGRIQMTATNISGIALGIIIVCLIGIKEFYHKAFIIWTIIYIICAPIGIYVVSNYIPYKGQVFSAAINIALYGYIWLKILLDIILQKKHPNVKPIVFSAWLIMLILMFVSINENIWPLWYALAFGAYYFIDCDSGKNKSLYVSAIDGIILGFFTLQGIALVFRPYDVPRYQGLYINPNFNALFYIMSYSAFLSKYYYYIYDNKKFLRKIVILLSGSMFGFVIFTGSKAALVTMLIITFVYAIIYTKDQKHRILGSIKFSALLGVIGVACIPVIYLSIRWIPTIHLHPLYFEGEYSEYRVLPGEPSDSEKYISFEEAMEENAGRVFYMFPNIRSIYDSIFTMKVRAAGLNDTTEPQSIFSYEDIQAGISPLRLRYEIYKYYAEKFNLIGHRNDYQGAQIYPYYTADHAHNVFIQMTFLYGIPAGIFFIFMVFSYIPGCVKLIKNGEGEKVCTISCFIIGFVVFGLFEIDWMCGQLPFTMFFVLYRDIVRKYEIRFVN